MGQQSVRINGLPRKAVRYWVLLPLDLKPKSGTFLVKTYTGSSIKSWTKVASRMSMKVAEWHHDTHHNNTMHNNKIRDST